MTTSVPTVPSIARHTCVLRRFARDASGTTAIEYTLIAALIFLAIVGGLSFFASETQRMYDKISTTITRN